MIHGAFLEYDEGVWTLCLDDDMGTHRFVVDPADVDAALKPWREHMEEGEAVKHEVRVAALWPEAFACVDPEESWIEELRHQADVLKKRYREDAA